VGRQSALHKENSGFAAPTLGLHISMFRGYQILFSRLEPLPSHDINDEIIIYLPILIFNPILWLT
jgi:hypothetical protein